MHTFKQGWADFIFRHPQRKTAARVIRDCPVASFTLKKIQNVESRWDCLLFQEIEPLLTLVIMEKTNSIQSCLHLCVTDTHYVVSDSPLLTKLNVFHCVFLISYFTDRLIILLVFPSCLQTLVKLKFFGLLKKYLFVQIN